MARFSDLAVVLAITLALCLCAAAQSTAVIEQDQNEPDAQPVHNFHVEVATAFHGENFRELENIAGAAASEQSRFAGGDWKLHAFYLTLQDPESLTASDDRWAAHMARLQRWAAAVPDSAVPRIALAMAYERYAWKARGSGTTKTVAPEDWKVFFERIKEARTILEQAGALPNRDVQWFVAMQTVALAQHWHRSDAEDLVDKASAIAPEYFYTYVRHLTYLLPRWAGKPGDAATYLNTVADRVGGPVGDFIYFRGVAANNCYMVPWIPAVSWDRTKRGFAAAEELYTTTNHERNQIAFLALQAGDKDFAQQMFTRIGDDWDQTVWGNKPRFNSARTTLALPTPPTNTSGTKAEAK